MKNILIVDIDTDRVPVVQLGKPERIVKPSNLEEAKKMILDDISCSCEALCVLIHMADQNKYASKQELVDTSIKYLNNLLKNEVNQS